MTQKPLLDKIAAAKSDIQEAERSLQEMIRTIGVGKRAEKTTISAGLQSAFEKLRVALAHLNELESLLAEADL